jgi:hypothetical protein
MKSRDWNAVDACLRVGGPMKHRNTPRGGANNSSRDLIADAAEESDNASDPHCAEDSEGTLEGACLRDDR